MGLYLSFRLRFLQFTKLKMSFFHLFKKSESGEEGDISHYQAVAAVLAGNFGTGNISGMAIALTTGGPGALVWMWVMTCFGVAIQYASCFLGVKYRQKNSAGEYVGGPMYYLSRGLGWTKLAMLFSVCVIVAAFSVGNFVQINSMVLPLEAMGINPLLAGGVIAVFVALVILGGAKQVARVSSGVVPVMALIYLGTALVILALNYTEIVPALGRLLSEALHFPAVVGGSLGFASMKALQVGFDRGIFATDAGTGTVPILQSGAKTDHPAVDGVVALTAPFLVMIVCTTTALVLMVTGAYGGTDLQSTNLVTYAFQQGVGRGAGTTVVLTSLVLFGFTTTLAWATCLERAVGFMFGPRWIRPFHYLYILLVPLGTILQVDFVWILADVALSLMMVINLLGIARLSQEVVGESRLYFAALNRKSSKVSS